MYSYSGLFLNSYNSLFMLSLTMTSLNVIHSYGFYRVNTFRILVTHEMSDAYLIKVIPPEIRSYREHALKCKLVSLFFLLGLGFKMHVYLLSRIAFRSARCSRIAVKYGSELRIPPNPITLKKNLASSLELDEQRLSGFLCVICLFIPKPQRVSDLYKPSNSGLIPQSVLIAASSHY